MSFQCRKWEKQLQQVHGETDVNVLEKAAQEHLQKYYESLPKNGMSQKKQKTIWTLFFTISILARKELGFRLF